MVSYEIPLVSTCVNMRQLMPSHVSLGREIGWEIKDTSSDQEATLQQQQNE